MNPQQAYDKWAAQYDSNINRTRDLEAIALRNVLNYISNADILEIGCGTGKNSEWLQTRAASLVAVDLSEQMLAKAKERLNGIDFIQADITMPWSFTQKQFDLVTFSLVLEHINDLDLIFKEAAQKLKPGGKLYIGELHPFKQYSGSKARFDDEEGTIVVTCYTHHISDFINQAKAHGFSVAQLQEWFDDDDKEGIPRILTLLLTRLSGH